MLLFVCFLMSQSLNWEALVYTPVVIFRPRLLIPHFVIPDIGGVNPESLKKLGIRGVIFDKDNTLTDPYDDKVRPQLMDCLADYRRVFGEGLAIMSNDAGTSDDLGFVKARELEEKLDLAVLSGHLKKPFGIKAAIEYFDCDPKYLAVVGDRILTDIVFGNRYGMLTFLVTDTTTSGDNVSASRIRNLELPLVKRLQSLGLRAPKHQLYNSDCLIQR